MDFDQSPTVYRLYTADEANATLDEIRELVGRMRAAAATGQQAGELVRAFGARVSASGGGRPADEDTQAQRELGEASARLHDVLDELAARGIRVKDPVLGLVDFLSERDGEIVELCWLDGEAEVGHWHRIGHGFAGRRPLTDEER